MLIESLIIFCSLLSMFSYLLNMFIKIDHNITLVHNFFKKDEKLTRIFLKEQLKEGFLDSVFITEFFSRNSVERVILKLQKKTLFKEEFQFFTSFGKTKEFYNEMVMVITPIFVLAIYYFIKVKCQFI